MIAWPDLARDAATATPAREIDWPNAGGRLPVAPPPEAEVTETPRAGQEPHPPSDAALEETPTDAPPPPLRRRRWPMTAAVALSLAAHAGLAVWFAERLSRTGLEAEADAISVEIVLEPDPEAQAPAIAGEAAQASDGGEEGQAGPVAVVEAKEVPPDEPAAAAPDENSPQPADETLETADADDRIAAREPDADVQRETADEVVAAAAPDSVTAPEPPTEDAVQEAPPPSEAPAILMADPFRPELATPPAMPPPADDIPLETVPAPMPRPERPVAEKSAGRAVARQQETRRPTREPRHTADDSDRKATPRRERTDDGAPNARQRVETGPTKAQTAGNAARSASSAGAVASYARKVNGHLQRHKSYPQEAARARMKGAVSLTVTIDRSGRLSGARVRAGSGHAVLDQEALATARRASPYPAPPQGVAGRTLTLNFTLRYGR